MSSGWWFLAAMIAAYGIANLLQSIAATRTAGTESLDPGLLLRLFGHRTYLLGLGCQMLGFFLALGARRDLPLFLVQSAVTAGLCVTAILGVVLLKWRLPMAEIGLLGAVVLGITALASSARPGHAAPLSARGVMMLMGALGVIAVLGFFAGRIKGVPGSVVLGSLAGLCFSSAAIAARPLAAAHTIFGFVTNPLLYLVIVHSLLGQLLLGLAMQRGSTNAAVAAMDAVGAVPAAAIGLLLLGDKIRPGMEWVAGAGFVITLGAVIALTRYAEPQHELVAEPTPVPVRRTVDVPGLPPHPARGVYLVPGAATASPAGDASARGLPLGTPAPAGTRAAPIGFPVPAARQEPAIESIAGARETDAVDEPTAAHPVVDDVAAESLPAGDSAAGAADRDGRGPSDDEAPPAADTPTAAYPMVRCDEAAPAPMPVGPASQPGPAAVEHGWSPAVPLPLASPASQTYLPARQAARPGRS